MVNTVVEIYLGLVTGMPMLQALALQLAWALALMAAARLALRLGQRKLVIQGG
jgi:ABC-2 type transport system permease protein